MHLHIITVIAMAMLLVMMITIVVMLLLMVIVFQFASLALLWRCSLCCVCFGQRQLGPTMLLHIITVSAMAIYFSSVYSSLQLNFTQVATPHFAA